LSDRRCCFDSQTSRTQGDSKEEPPHPHPPPPQHPPENELPRGPSPFFGSSETADNFRFTGESTGVSPSSIPAQETASNLTNLSKKCNENKTMIEVMKSDNFDLNINIDYLKENNIVELIDLLKQNKLPEIVTLSISSLKEEIINDMTSNISSTFSSLKNEFDTKCISYTVTNNKIFEEINQISAINKILNDKILYYNDFINLSIDNNNKKFNKKISDVRYKYNCLQREIDTYLDKTYMVVGFHPGTVIPNIVLRTNEYGSAPIRKEVADYWNTQPPCQIINVN